MTSSARSPTPRSSARAADVLLLAYFSTVEKADGLDRAVTDADPIVVNFLKLLIENHRTPAVFRVRREFDRLWQEENKLLPVQVTSAVELDQATVDQIGDRIAQQTGRKIDLSARSSRRSSAASSSRRELDPRRLDPDRLEQLRKQVARA